MHPNILLHYHGKEIGCTHVFRSFLHPPRSKLWLTLTGATGSISTYTIIARSEVIATLVANSCKKQTSHRILHLRSMLDKGCYSSLSDSFHPICSLVTVVLLGGGVCFGSYLVQKVTGTVPTRPWCISRCVCGPSVSTRKIAENLHHLPHLAPGAADRAEASAETTAPVADESVHECCPKTAWSDDQWRWTALNVWACPWARPCTFPNVCRCSPTKRYPWLRRRSTRARSVWPTSQFSTIDAWSTPNAARNAATCAEWYAVPVTNDGPLPCGWWATATPSTTDDPARSFTPYGPHESWRHVASKRSAGHGKPGFDGSRANTNARPVVSSPNRTAAQSVGDTWSKSDDAA
jgi:hypothetical protein